MPGILPGIASGLEAGANIAHQEGVLSMEKKQQQLVQARSDREEALKKNVLGLGMIENDIKEHATEAKPYIAVVRNVPSDPTEAAAYRSSDVYKQAVAKLTEMTPDVQALHDQADEKQTEISGIHFDTTKERAQHTYQRMLQGQEVSGGDLSDALMMGTKLPSDVWVKDASGQSVMDRNMADLQTGIQSGDFSHAGNAIAMLLPELNSGIGAKSPDGGVAGNVSVVGLHYDPQDPTYLIPQVSVTKHMPDGSVSTMQSEPMSADGHRIPVQLLVDRAKQYQQIAAYTGQPDVQKKLQDAHANGDTVLHRIVDTFADAGSPVAPQFSLKTVPGGVMVSTDDGSPPHFMRTQLKITTATQRQDLMDALKAAHAGGDPDEITSAQSDLDQFNANIKGQDRLKNPNLRSGGGTKRPTQGAVNGAIKAATDALAGQYGYTLQGKDWMKDNDLATGDPSYAEFNTKRIQVEKAITDAANDTKNPRVLKQDEALGAVKDSTAPKKPAVPKVGEIRKGYKFKGGNPADQKNWDKV